MPSQLEPSSLFSTNPGLIIFHFICKFVCILLFIHGNLALSYNVKGTIEGLGALTAHF
jgi:hypothetical protein